MPLLSFHVPSRLKGIETLDFAERHGVSVSTFHVPSRLKGIETHLTAKPIKLLRLSMYLPV